MTRRPRRLRDRALRSLPVACLGLTLAGCKDVVQQPVAGPNDVGGTMVVVAPAEAATLLPQ
ncbi:MAG: hypothetical protein ABI601_16435, partial [bacterium]